MMDKVLGGKERWLIIWLTNTEGGEIYPGSGPQMVIPYFLLV
jgi:hypothetical protein